MKTNTMTKPALMLMLMLTATSAMAQAVPGTTWLSNVANFLTGPAGVSLAIIGLAIVGIGAFMGKMSWERAAMVMVGIILVFGAPQIIAWVRTGIA